MHQGSAVHIRNSCDAKQSAQATKKEKKSAVQCIKGVQYTRRECNPVHIGSSCDAWQSAQATKKENGGNVRPGEGPGHHLPAPRYRKSLQNSLIAFPLVFPVLCLVQEEEDEEVMAMREIH
jgi:hypothetical protein